MVNSSADDAILAEGIERNDSSLQNDAPEHGQARDGSSNQRRGNEVFAWGRVALFVAIGFALVLAYGSWFGSNGLIDNYRRELTESFSTYVAMQPVVSGDTAPSDAKKVLLLGNRIHLLAQRVAMLTDDDSVRWRHAVFLKQHGQNLERCSRFPKLQNNPVFVKKLAASRESIGRFRSGLVERMASSTSAIGMQARLLKIRERIESRQYVASQIDDLSGLLREILKELEQEPGATEPSLSESTGGITSSKELSDEIVGRELLQRQACRLLGFLCLDSAWANAEASTPHFAKEVDIEKALVQLGELRIQFVRLGLRNHFYVIEYLLRSRVDRDVGPMEEVYFQPGYEDSLDAVLKFTHACLVGRRDEVISGVNSLSQQTSDLAVDQVFVGRELAKNLCRFAVSNRLRSDSLAAEAYGSQIQLAVDMTSEIPEVSSLVWWLSILRTENAAEVPEDIAAMHRHLIDAARVSPSGSLFVTSELIRSAFDDSGEDLRQASETSALLSLSTDGILANVAIWRSGLEADEATSRTWVELLRFAFASTEGNRRSSPQMLLIASTIWSVQLGDREIAEVEFAKAERALESLQTLEVLRQRVQSMPLPIISDEIVN